MSFEELVLPPSESVVRLFARHPSSLGKPIKIRPKDFDRGMGYMSGISMYRAKAKEVARGKWGSEWPKGILIGAAGPIQELGLVFYHTGNDHFSVRCPICDLNRNQTVLPLCKKTVGLCDFDPASALTAAVGQTIPVGIRDRLVKLFSVDTAPY
jgi:hypothetical protein